MFELRRIGPLDIRQRLIRLDDPVRDETVHLSYVSGSTSSSQDYDTNAGQILVQAKSVEVTTAEHQRTKVLSDRLVQTLGRSQR